MTRRRTARCSIACGAAVVAASLLFLGCSGGEDGSGDDGQGGVSVITVDRAPAVESLVDEVVVPRYREAGEAVTGAAAAAEELCGSPDPARLVAARTAVDEALVAWNALGPIDMGPVMDLRANSQVAPAVDTERIDRLLADGPPADAEAATKETASEARGLGAAAHLLVVGPEALDPDRCTYLLAVTGGASEVAGEVLAEWFDADPSYADRLAGRGEDAVPAQDVIDDVVNMAVDVLESDAKALGEPDATAGGAASAQAVAAAHVGTISALVGDDRVGLASMVSSLRSGPLREDAATAVAALAAEPFDAGAAVDAIDRLRATLATEIVAALDVTVGFSENDGDA